MNMIKLSFIVPIYNVEQYLLKCVDSLLNQDMPLSEYEIILVDDGSPDACPQICDEYAAGHENIRVVHRENGGLSAARNSGIEVAQGEYICFVDSDDYWEPNRLGALIEQAESEQLDVLRFNYQNVNELYEVFLPYKDAKRDVDYDGSITDGETFLNERLGPSCYVTQFILRCELLDDCLFKEGVYFEDTEWTPRMLLKAQRVTSTPMIVYNYLWRTGSITQPKDPEKREKIIRDKILLIRGFQKQSMLVRDPKWFTWMTAFTTITVLNALASLPSKKRQIYIKELKSLHIFPLSSEKEHGSHKLKIMLANFSPTLYCKLMSFRQ